ncbi:hypothetical protein L1987_57717 [Smallanthus sonchifolius]|uniref:Uncharacterized protein n=1 Tax=Smallanthus sonchifolius TaxID=185202 RepID=A0ACB9DDD7_9ASTR|nr:hypothetical protein L1987_57717 [Smallanthus sonchifolius]
MFREICWVACSVDPTIYVVFGFISIIKKKLLLLFLNLHPSIHPSSSPRLRNHHRTVQLFIPITFPYAIPLLQSITFPLSLYIHHFLSLKSFIFVNYTFLSITHRYEDLSRFCYLRLSLYC